MCYCRQQFWLSAVWASWVGVCKRGLAPTTAVVSLFECLELVWFWTYTYEWQFMSFCSLPNVVWVTFLTACKICLYFFLYCLAFFSLAYSFSCCFYVFHEVMSSVRSLANFCSSLSSSCSTYFALELVHDLFQNLNLLVYQKMSIILLFQILLICIKKNPSKLSVTVLYSILREFYIILSGFLVTQCGLRYHKILLLITFVFYC